MFECKDNVSVNEDDIEFTGFVVVPFHKTKCWVRHKTKSLRMCCIGWIFEWFDTAYFVYCLEIRYAGVSFISNMYTGFIFSLKISTDITRNWNSLFVSYYSCLLWTPSPLTHIASQITKTISTTGQLVLFCVTYYIHLKVSPTKNRRAKIGTPKPAFISILLGFFSFRNSYKIVGCAPPLILDPHLLYQCHLSQW